MLPPFLPFPATRLSVKNGSFIGGAVSFGLPCISNSSRKDSDRDDSGSKGDRYDQTLLCPDTCAHHVHFPSGALVLTRILFDESIRTVSF